MVQGRLLIELYDDNNPLPSAKQMFPVACVVPNANSKAETEVKKSKRTAIRLYLLLFFACYLPCLMRWGQDMLLFLNDYRLPLGCAFSMVDNQPVPKDTYFH